ncbi:hypothetical protein [Meiothermus hypogaeus]|uniref:Uncharacterized protein n=1 Tax=Meiothermus hypogaeus NBRC 106114 TaxID=1227553 RepID=A0A511R5R1_9DEIN|nr:hypothetical protein [Meiothermus hypogaeus]GEM84951.1 hypothetical protein MHY01S_31170 [Meiothermus hypogaeus NBRC 106114]
MDEQISVRLSICRALLGEINPKIRAVTPRVSQKRAEIKVFYDGQISEEDLEDMSDVEASVIADLHEDWSVDLKCVQVDFPESIPYVDGEWVAHARSESRMSLPRT